MGSVAADWKRISTYLPIPVYRGARVRAAGRSMNRYILDLICADLGIAPETLDYRSLPRSRWVDPEDAPAAGDRSEREHVNKSTNAHAMRVRNHLVNILIDPDLLMRVRRHLEGMAHTVTLSAYLRDLVSADVGDLAESYGGRAAGAGADRRPAAGSAK